MTKHFIFKVKINGQWLDREEECNKLHTALHYLAEGLERTYKPKQIKEMGLQIHLLNVIDNKGKTFSSNKGMELTLNPIPSEQD